MARSYFTDRPVSVSRLLAVVGNPPSQVNKPIRRPAPKIPPQQPPKVPFKAHLEGALADTGKPTEAEKTLKTVAVLAELRLLDVLPSLKK